MNVYGEDVYQQGFIKVNKPTDYLLDSSGVFISNQTDLSSGGITSTGRTRCAIWADNFPIVNDQEYTMNFKDICFYDNSGVIIYEQDVSSGTSSINRIQILKQPTTNFIQITISGETVYQSTTGVTPNVLYDMTITKDLSANYDVILNNTTLSKALITDVSRNRAYIGAPSNMLSSIGSFRSDVSSNPSNSQFSLTGFKYYEDLLSDYELSTMTAYTTSNNPTRLNKNVNWKLLLDISAATNATKSSYISFTTNMTADFSANTAINLNTYNGNQTLVLTSTSSSSNTAALNVPTDTTGIANRAIRVSFWARSTDLTAINALELTIAANTNKIVTLTDTYTRYIVYIQPDINQFIRTGNLTIRLGKESQSSDTANLLYGDVFKFATGTVYIAGLKVYQGNAPLYVNLDLIKPEYDSFNNKTTAPVQSFYSTAIAGKRAEYTMNIDKPPCQGNFFKGDRVYTSQDLMSGLNPLLGWRRTVTGSNYSDWREIKGA
jgi:hypothetical protein